MKRNRGGASAICNTRYFLILISVNRSRDSHRGTIEHRRRSRKEIARKIKDVERLKRRSRTSIRRNAICAVRAVAWPINSRRAQEFRPCRSKRVCLEWAHEISTVGSGCGRRIRDDSFCAGAGDPYSIRDVDSSPVKDLSLDITQVELFQSENNRMVFKVTFASPPDIERLRIMVDVDGSAHGEPGFRSGLHARGRELLPISEGRNGLDLGCDRAAVHSRRRAHGHVLCFRTWPAAVTARAGSLRRPSRTGKRPTACRRPAR